MDEDASSSCLALIQHPKWNALLLLESIPKWVLIIKEQRG
jgi:hypothetical protein